ncbi:MAG: hypothetical protein AAGD33_21820 [Actinomycetota bacterium]
MIRSIFLVASLLAGATACGGSDGDADDAPAATSIEDTTTAPVDEGSTLPSTTGSGLAPFCSMFTSLQGEVPEEYVGSADHVTDIEALLAVAPTDVASEIDEYRAFLASGVVDASIDPESTQFDNWPSEIQAAILDVQAFANDAC